MTDVALDSGAYSIDSGAVSGDNLTIDAYAEYVKKEGDRYTIRFTFDKLMDGAQSYKNWVWLRKQGLDVLPVYHPGTPEKYLKRYLRQTDYISLGSVANMHRGELMKVLRIIWQDHLLDKKDNPICKVHGLGITSYNVMAAFPWYSVDSTSANIRAAYGTMLLPQRLDTDGKEGVVHLAVLLDVVKNLPVDQAARAVQPDRSRADPPQRKDQLLEVVARIGDGSARSGELIEPRLRRPLPASGGNIARFSRRHLRPDHDRSDAGTQFQQLTSRHLRRTCAIPPALTHGRPSPS